LDATTSIYVVIAVCRYFFRKGKLTQPLHHYIHTSIVTNFRKKAIMPISKGYKKKRTGHGLEILSHTMCFPHGSSYRMTLSVASHVILFSYLAFTFVVVCCLCRHLLPRLLHNFTPTHPQLQRFSHRPANNTPPAPSILRVGCCQLAPSSNNLQTLTRGVAIIHRPVL
jgi:hypothetical protein